ncbi:MAG TPA: hypothetical protein VLX92_07990 [Kofleriaceae bacterium]|nr:hypothetical protein [Kofleriaceae bacterium]
MRKIISAAALSLTLFGGVAMADTRDHRAPVRHEEVRRDFRARPAPRFERHEERRGFRWVGGEWRWGARGWDWRPGYYARVR